MEGRIVGNPYHEGAQPQVERPCTPRGSDRAEGVAADPEIQVVRHIVRNSDIVVENRVVEGEGAGNDDEDGVGDSAKSGFSEKGV